jgi:tRNA dimethylallyltransferase
MQILLDGIFDDKRNSTEYREKLNREADEVGIEKLYMQLKKMDPEAAKKIHSNDKRRIIRALEVINSLKTSLTQAKTKRKGIWTEYDVCLYGLFIERELLYKNINERVDRMFASGLLEEAKKLQSDYKLSKTARGALGYKELFTYFNGDCTLDEAKELIKRNTRHYAKKQMTWFNKEKRITWIKVGFADKPQKIADKIYKDVKNKL